jgi:thiamine biosynthesis lipoprotein
MEYYEFSAMNTTIQVAAEGSRDDLDPGFQRVRQFIAECEARFSRFREDSELCQLNHSAGSWFQASVGMFDLMQEVLKLYQLTGGLFDPSVLKALQQAGYDRSFDAIQESGSLPFASTVEPITSHLGHARLDPTGVGIYLPAGVQIDLGGIAKGWIAEKATQLLTEYTSACAVSAGGDMAFHGTPYGEPAWQISLEDPRDEQGVLAVLQVQSGGLATSSITRRRWLQGSQVRHHIIDPRTGSPARVEWLSVSVGAPKATTAEAFAKAILIGGSHVGTQLAGKIPELWFIAVNPDGSLSGTQESKEIVYESVDFQPAAPTSAESTYFV